MNNRVNSEQKKGERNKALPSETREAMKEAEALMADPGAERFTTLEDLFEDLGI